MHPVKDSPRSLVRIGFDGRVHKIFRGHFARERYNHELLVLRYLESRGCDFIPRVLEEEPELLKFITTNCGQPVEIISQARQDELFAELEGYGVRHEDRAKRNITYRTTDGRLCLIDFEYATFLDGPHVGKSLKPFDDADQPEVKP